MTKELAYVKGVLAGDGSLSRAGRMVSLPCTIDEDFAAEFTAAAGNLVPHIPRVYLIEPGRYSNGSWFYSVYSYWKGWPEMLKEPVGRYWLYWLRGMVDSEGSVMYKPPSNSRWVNISNTDTALLRRCECYLARLGIDSRLRLVVKAGTEVTFPSGVVTASKRDSYIQHISRRPNLERFYKYVGFRIEHKQRKLEAALATYKLTRHWSWDGRVYSSKQSGGV